MAICGQNHSHLEYVLCKLSRAKNNSTFFNNFLSKFFKVKKENPHPLPKCVGCAYVMGYKDGLKGICSSIENVPYREIEMWVNTSAEAAYQRGLDDGSKERLYQ